MLTPALLQAFFVNQDMRYQNAYAKHVPYWQTYAELVPSTTETMIHHWLAQQPRMVEWIGEKKINQIKARAYPLTNKDWEHTYDVDRNKLADDQMGIYARAPETQAEVAARWPEDLVTAALINGTTALGYDGQYFFDTDHPVDIDDSSLGTYSNLNTSAPFNETTYAAAKAQMRSFKGEGGVSLQVMPTVTMVGPSNEAAAKKVLQANTLVTSVRNVAGSEIVAAAAGTNVWQGDTILYVNERLVDDTAGAWYMFSTNRLAPLVFQQREAPHRISILDPQNPLVFNQKKFAFSIEARGTAGYTLPFLAIKNVP